MTFPHAPQPGPASMPGNWPVPSPGGFRPGPPPGAPRPGPGGFRPGSPNLDRPAGDRPAGDRPAVERLAPLAEGEGTGHVAVDAVLQSLDNAAALPPGEQIAAYEAAHRVLQETLTSIDG